MVKELDSRFAFIEQIALWEGRVNTTHLINKYSLSRQAASGILKQYRSIYPENLQYSSSIKAYEPTSVFVPESKLTQFSDYLNSVQTRTLNGNKNEFCTTIATFEVEAPLRNINPLQVRPILFAIREQLAIDIGYISLSSPDYLDRIIQPHALIFDGLRWHVRAFCNKNQQYRDFSLSRFNGQATIEGKADQGVAQDVAWNTMVDVVIEPDSRLSSKQKQIIAEDFQMSNGQKTIQTRAALVNYLLLRLRLDSYKNTPEEQQIVLTTQCRKNIAQYLPK